MTDIAESKTLVAYQAFENCFIAVFECEYLYVYCGIEPWESYATAYMGRLSRNTAVNKSKVV